MDVNYLRKRKYYSGLIASIFLICYAFWKLNRFYEPKVGPIGSGPSDTVEAWIWILFGISMILGFGGVIYFAYSILKRG